MPDSVVVKDASGAAPDPVDRRRHVYDRLAHVARRRVAAAADPRPLRDWVMTSSRCSAATCPAPDDACPLMPRC